MELFQKILKGGLVVFILRISLSFIGVITTLLLSRELGADLYGVFALSMSIVLISSKISLLGMPNAILRFYPIYKNNADRKKGLLIICFGSAIVMAFVITFIHYLAANNYSKRIFEMPQLDQVIQIVVLSLPIMAFIQIFASIYQAEKNVLKYVGLGELYPKIVFLFLILSIKLTGHVNLINCVCLYVLSFSIVFIIACKVFWNKFSKLYVTDCRRVVFHFKEIFNFSIPSFLIGFGFILLTQCDRIMVGIYLKSYDVGVYSVCAKIAVFMNIILVSMNAIFVPTISELFWSHRKNELSEIFKLVTKWTWIFSIALFVFFYFSAESILSVFGSEFVSGRMAFIILSFGFLLNSACGSNGFMLQMTGNQYLELCNSLATVFLNIILNIILIPKFGINGASIATGLSMTSINLARLVEFYKIEKIHPFSLDWLKVAFGFCVLFATILFAKADLKDNVGVNLSSFLIFLILFSFFIYKVVLSREDKVLANKFFAKFSGKLK